MRIPETKDWHTKKMAEGMAVSLCQVNLQNARKIYDFITTNNLDGIRSLLDHLTLRNRQLIVCQLVCNKTLLGYACELRFRDIVKYLLDECGADVSETYTPYYIPLHPVQVSIDNLDVLMVLLLLSRGAVSVDNLQVNISSQYAFKKKYSSLGWLLNRYNFLLPLQSLFNLRNTPLCILNASRCGDLDRMRNILEFGINARAIDRFEDNALCLAILNEDSNAEHLLLNYRTFTLKEYVSALELCGAKSIVFRSQLNKGVQCWKKSIRIRNEHFFGVLDKFRNKAKMELGFEFINEEQLEMLVNCEADLYIQALIVMARLLSPLGEVIQDACVIVANLPVFDRELLRAIKVLGELSVFVYISASGSPNPFNRSVEALHNLLRHHFYNDQSDMGKFLFQFRSLLDFMVGICWQTLFGYRKSFYFVVHLECLKLVLLNISAMQSFTLCKKDEVWIKEGIRKIMRWQSDPYTTTLLHLAIETPSVSSSIPFILSSSVDANCTNHLKITPMHAVSLLPSNKSHILHLIQLLADAGGHIDAVNKFGMTPFMTLKVKGAMKNFLKYFSLQCLAAQTIYKYNVKVPEHYPKILVSFIKLHSH